LAIARLHPGVRQYVQPDVFCVRGEAGESVPWTNGTCFTQTGAVPCESGLAPVTSLY